MPVLNNISEMPNDLRKVRVVAVLLSIVLSILAVWQSDIVGRDSILYLQTAITFVDEGVAEAFQLFKWPFYPFLIAGVHKLTGLPFEQAGFLLNSILALLIVDTFIRLYQEINPQSRYLWLPAVVILAFTGMNEYRDEIVRGWGFWAFSLLAFLHLFRFIRTKLGRDALLWQLYIIIAALFRKEACAYMLLAPLILFIDAHPEGRWKEYIKANVLLMFVFISSVVGLVVLKNPFVEKLFSALMSYFKGNDPWTNFMEIATTMGHEVLTMYSADNAPLMLAAGIFTLIAYKILTKLGLFYAVVTLAGLFKSTLPRECHTRFIWGLLLISYLIVVLFFSQTLIITGRYILLSSLLMLLLTTCYMETWVDYLKGRKGRWVFLLFVLPLIFNVLAGFHLGEGKIYMRKAGDWVKSNLSQEVVLLTNDTRLQYYSGRKYDFTPEMRRLVMGEGIDDDVLLEQDFLLLREKKGAHPAVNVELLTKVKSFVSAKGDGAVLYKVNRRAE